MIYAKVPHHLNSRPKLSAVYDINSHRLTKSERALGSEALLVGFLVFCGLAKTLLGPRVLNLTNNHGEDRYSKPFIGRGSPDM